MIPHLTARLLIIVARKAFLLINGNSLTNLRIYDPDWFKLQFCWIQLFFFIFLKEK